MPNITSSVWLCCCCCAVNVVVCAVNVVVQCDHMLRLFAQHSGPFTVKKIALNQVNWKSGFKILPNIIYALKRIQKTLKILPNLVTLLLLLLLCAGHLILTETTKLIKTVF